MITLIILLYPGIQVTKIKVMKKKLLLFFFSFLMLNVQAQFDNLLNKAKQKTKDKVNQRIDQKMDKTIDKTLDNAESSTKLIILEMTKKVPMVNQEKCRVGRRFH